MIVTCIRHQIRPISQSLLFLYCLWFTCVYCVYLCIVSWIVENTLSRIHHNTCVTNNILCSLVYTVFTGIHIVLLGESYISPHVVCYNKYQQAIFGQLQDLIPYVWEHAMSNVQPPLVLHIGVGLCLTPICKTTPQGGIITII